MSRKRGRIVLVGVVGLNLARGDFYEKELTFQVSCSYGPGRYDEVYERQGIDYPYGFVRWTQQRNFEAILSAMRAGSLGVDDLITHRFAFDDAGDAYRRIKNDRGAIGVVLEYPREVDRSVTIAVSSGKAASSGGAIVGVIGAGSFAKAVLMPALAGTDARIAWVADLNGASAGYLAGKLSATGATSDYRQILRDDSVNAVIIAVRHNLHARLVVEALEAGKHVFVEKPLAMNVQEVRQVIEAAAKARDRIVTVGFNRRFSAHTVKMKHLLSDRKEPLAMTMVVNAGVIGPDSWVQDPVRGGGRIIGEGCHFIDLLVYLAGSAVKTVSAAKMRDVTVEDDKMSIVLGFEDGSIGTVNYFSNGSGDYPKESLEVFSDGRVLRLDDFRCLKGYGFKGFKKLKTRRDKGHNAEFAAFVDRVKTGGEPLIALNELVNVTLSSFAAVTSANESRMITIADEYGDVLKV